DDSVFVKIRWLLEDDEDVKQIQQMTLNQDEIVTLGRFPKDERLKLAKDLVAKKTNAKLLKEQLKKPARNGSKKNKPTKTIKIGKHDIDVSVLSDDEFAHLKSVLEVRA